MYTIPQLFRAVFILRAVVILSTQWVIKPWVCMLSTLLQQGVRAATWNGMDVDQGTTTYVGVRAAALCCWRLCACRAGGVAGQAGL
jgi:hypothetical protein